MGVSTSLFAKPVSPPDECTSSPIIFARGTQKPAALLAISRTFGETLTLLTGEERNMSLRLMSETRRVASCWPRG